LWAAFSLAQADSVGLGLLSNRNAHLVGLRRSERQSPEAITEDFALLKRCKIYEAIALDLGHHAEIDKYLEESAREFATNSLPLSGENPSL
jgi:hypothetical protein